MPGNLDTRKARARQASWQPPLADPLAARMLSPMGTEIPSKDAHEGHTLTRAQVAARLGISTSSVRRLEGIELHPVQDARGVWRFDSAEVARVPPRARQQESLRARGPREVPTGGEIAARIFRLFDAGRELSEIVIATRQPPSTVRWLYREWSTGLEAGEHERAARAKRAVALR